MTQGLGGFLLILGGGWGSGCAGGSRAGDGTGFKCFQVNQNIKLNKNQKYPKLMYEVPVMCSKHLTNNVFFASQKGCI